MRPPHPNRLRSRRLHLAPLFVAQAHHVHYNQPWILHADIEFESDATMSFATKIIPDKTNNVVTLEDYGTQRIRLQQVKRESGN
jgi:hypothetical protein